MVGDQTPRSTRGKHGRKKHETSHSPMFFLGEVALSKAFWRCLVWHLWIGRARHPGPRTGFMWVEISNVSGWLTNGDGALEAGTSWV